MVQNGGFGGTGGLPVVVRGHRVEQLGRNGSVESRSPRFNQPQAKMDMTQQAALVGLAEGRAAPELHGAADIVKERSREEEVVAETRMKLCGLAAQRGNAHGVLE